MFPVVRCTQLHSMEDTELKFLKYIVLTQIKSLGPVSQNALIDMCGDINACFEASYSELIALDKMQISQRNRIGKGRIESFIYQREDRSLWNYAERMLRTSEELKIIPIVREDLMYPARFRNNNDMPVLIYTRGCLEINEYENSTGIVGARRCSAEGKHASIEIATESTRDDTAVISGMAKGIDSYTHTAVLKRHGYTIAVLGSGADICYPKEHERLYEEIVEHGCIVSEYPPGTQPREYYFPQRNRLIAALSDKLCVIDAGRNSGTRSTVEYAKKYGREIVMVGEMIKQGERECTNV